MVQSVPLSHPPYPSIAQSFGNLLRFSPHHCIVLPKEVARPSFTAYIERAQLYPARSTSKKDSLPALYFTLEKYEWDVSYTLACRRLRRQRGLASGIKPGSVREPGTSKRTLRTRSTS